MKQRIEMITKLASHWLFSQIWPVIALKQSEPHNFKAKAKLPLDSNLKEHILHKFVCKNLNVPITKIYMYRPIEYILIVLGFTNFK